MCDEGGYDVRGYDADEGRYDVRGYDEGRYDAVGGYDVREDMI